MLSYPKTTCFLSRWGNLSKQMKNWEAFESAPELAIDRIPGLVCLWIKFSSSKLSPYIDSPPVPLKFVKSPPYAINPGITLWKIESLKCKALPHLPIPFSPVQSALKFSAVLGTTSCVENQNILTLENEIRSTIKINLDEEQIQFVLSLHHQC